MNRTKAIAICAALLLFATGFATAADINATVFKITGKAEFTGKRIPAPGAAPDLAKVKFGEPIQLFNGKIQFPRLDPHTDGAQNLRMPDLFLGKLQPKRRHFRKKHSGKHCARDLPEKMANNRRKQYRGFSRRRL